MNWTYSSVLTQKTLNPLQPLVSEWISIYIHPLPFRALSRGPRGTSAVTPHADD